MAGYLHSRLGTAGFIKPREHIHVEDAEVTVYTGAEVFQYHILCKRGAFTLLHCLNLSTMPPETSDTLVWHFCRDGDDVAMINVSDAVTNRGVHSCKFCSVPFETDLLRLQRLINL